MSLGSGQNNTSIFHFDTRPDVFQFKLVSANFSMANINAAASKFRLLRFAEAR